MMTMMMIWIMEQARHCCPAGGVAGPAAGCQVLQLGVSMHGDDGDDDGGKGVQCLLIGFEFRVFISMSNIQCSGLSVV